jgi:dihydropteroate synthase
MATIDLSQAQVMGILNVTPDSFSDGGRFTVLDDALRQVDMMQREGATLVDVGGESTRPGAQAVSEQDELDRVIPVVAAIRERFEIGISVDTSKTEVMRQAVAAGASMINDVNALRAEGAMSLMAGINVPVCLMHMQGEPRTMQADPQYSDVVADVERFLLNQAQILLDAGVAKSQICIDPGFGFGKTLEHNLALFNAIPRLATHGFAVLVGVSRKSMLGQITGREISERMPGSVAAALLAWEKGAKILRVHDVAETIDALKLWKAINNQLPGCKDESQIFWNRWCTWSCW